MLAVGRRWRCTPIASVVWCQHAESEAPEEGCGSRACVGGGGRVACDAYTFGPSVGRDALWPSGRSNQLPSLNLVDAPQPV